MGKFISATIFILVVASIAIALGRLDGLANFMALPTATEYPTAEPLAMQSTLTPRPTYTDQPPYPTSTDWPPVYITETPEPTATIDPCPNGLAISIRNTVDWGCFATPRTYQARAQHNCYGGYSTGVFRHDGSTFARLSGGGTAGGYFNVSGLTFAMLTSGCSGSGSWTLSGSVLTRAGSGNNSTLTIVSTP